MMNIDELITSILAEEYKLLKSQGEFEEWLAKCLEKSPEYDYIDISTIPSNLLEEDEYVPAKTISYKTDIPKVEAAFNSDWLLKECSKISSPFPPEELGSRILTLLQDETRNLENELLDLLGFDSVEFVFSLVANKDVIVSSCSSIDPTKNSSIHLSNLSSLSRPHPPTAFPGQSIQLNTVSSKLEAKQLRKLVSKGIIPQLEDSPGLNLDSIERSLRQVLGDNRATVSKLPNVYMQTRTTTTIASKFALPFGTEHTDFPNYEEFIIPYQNDNNSNRSLASSVKQVPISQLDDVLQSGFKGYQTLNKMQSIVFPTAHYSNENLLVCAPTGAGKTDVALLTILKLVRDHLIELIPPSKYLISKNDFKVVYVAPMKALAAEITAKFSKKLLPFGLKVREYTGDMQLSRKEIQETQMIVTTPEKWDVITRKSLGDVDLVQKVKLLIIDEVHLLQDDRGPVIETLVTRTLREVETSQRMIRIVGLSATLPNFVDVATFLRVNHYTGLYVFADDFRPVPLTQQFIGIKGRNQATFIENLNTVTFEKCRQFVSDGHQVMVFVHSRNETVKTAKQILKLAQELGYAAFFRPDTTSKEFELSVKAIGKSRNRDLQFLFPHGFAFHHAGMVRSDRNLVEQLFGQGRFKVLVCTSTLAWGVNLPAHAVIIKGTQVYDQEKGEFVQLGVLDVLQIFGRAGRPQFETHGEGLILTQHENLTRYINSIMSQIPIESQFLKSLPENLNAEISIGTVSNLNEAVAWLKYSYLYVRMRRNPIAYGIQPKEISADPELGELLLKICKETVIKLRNCGMVSFDPSDPAGIVRIRDVGRIASSFYLSQETVEIFGQNLKHTLNEEDVLSLASMATEFNKFRVREEELRELDELYQGAPIRVKNDLTTASGKASLLILAYISHVELDTFSLISDSTYIGQNAGRIFRALFEIVRSQKWTHATLKCLCMCQAFERRVWPMQHPLSQFQKLTPDIIHKLERKNPSIDTLRELSKAEIAALIDNQKAAQLVKTLSKCFPTLNISSSLYPINKHVLRIDLTIVPTFDFDPFYHGTSDLWWIFVENPLTHTFLHNEDLSITRSQSRMTRKVSIHVPLKEPHPPQLYVRVINDRWLHSEIAIPISFKHLLLPEDLETKHTNLLPLKPLPITALNNYSLEKLYSERFLFFNSVQSQLFHPLYFGGGNIMVGAPTGSGKTVLAELAIWNLFKDDPKAKVVYVAPLKSLIKERLSDWKVRFLDLGISVEEVSGDTAPEIQAINMANLILTTPEKWDCLSRGWNDRKFVTTVGLIILDEIHLLGGERGHVLEMIITRMRKVLNKKIRFVGLSTALANPNDIGKWMDIPDHCLFNFRPSVRPVPLEVRIEGFAGRHYCPRMAAMNKPIYSAISSYSFGKPVLIFVSSRRQTRLTANALISYCVNDNQPYRFLKMDEEACSTIADQVVDPNLKHSLSFGIVLHHAGLVESDRQISEDLFVNGKVQIMIATSTLAWGVNFPAHLVIVKGTEFFDANSHSYVDYPLTDVMQMIGRAGRPQFDQQAKAVLLVQDSKKEFYKKFLYESFPLESSLHLKNYLADHINAEIANGNVKALTDGVDFLQNTYLAIRLKKNPNFYGLKSGDKIQTQEFLFSLINAAFGNLEKAGCIKRNLEAVESTFLGKISSKFYICYSTAQLFSESIDSNVPYYSLLNILSLASEFDNVPVRHNEDVELEMICKEFLSRELEMAGGKLFFSSTRDWNSPHTKVFVLLVAYLSDFTWPIADLNTDTTSIFEQCGRLIQAMLEISKFKFLLDTTLNLFWLQQSLTQGISIGHSSSSQLPFIPRNCKVTLPELLHDAKELAELIKVNKLESHQVEKVKSILSTRIPRIKLDFELIDENSQLSIRCVIRDERPSLPFMYHRIGCKPLLERFHLIIGDPHNDCILAIAKITLKRRTIDIPFSKPDHRQLSELKLYWISENYLGIDQEYSLVQAK